MANISFIAKYLYFDNQYLAIFLILMLNLCILKNHNTIKLASTRVHNIGIYKSKHLHIYHKFI